MRLLLTLKTRKGSQLPFNYQAFINAWIYKTLQRADPELASWLHEHGFDSTGRNYKLFTFSPFHIFPYTINKENKTIVILSDTVELRLSFAMNDLLSNLVMGLFHDLNFSIGNKNHQTYFAVEQVEVIPSITFDTTTKYRAVSPICITKRQEGRRYAKYCSPKEDGYQTLFINNLLKKYEAAQAVLPQLPDLAANDITFTLLSNKFRQRLLHFKAHADRAIKIKGYDQFDFELTAPPSLQEFGYYAGFGEKNSQGFGFCEIVKR